MKTIFFLMMILFSPTVYAVQNQQDSSNISVDQAKQDYRVFLEQLKALNNQYKQVTGEMKKVLQDEGVPTINQDTGDLSIQKPSFGSSNTTPQVFGDVDIKESDKDITVKVDLPGMKKEAIKVSIRDNKFLHIEGQRDEETDFTKESGNTQYTHSERQHGAFERVVELPALVKDTGTEARYENGVLTVKIPKADTAKKEVSVSIR